MSADDYTGIVHVSEACVYCDQVARVNPDLWEWYASGLTSRYRARFTWSGVVRDVARERDVLVHPVGAEGSFWSGGPTNYAMTSDYVALPLYAEEALRHVQYEERALRRLFSALADKDVRAAAGAAWSLGGRWALRDYLRTAGAIRVSAPEDPWEVRPSGDAESDRRLAIERGLRAHGYGITHEYAYTWPRWVTLAYFNADRADEVAAVRMLAESGQDVQDAVCAAYNLGGNKAVEGFVAQLLSEHRAQEEFTGRTNRSEETV